MGGDGTWALGSRAVVERGEGKKGNQPTFSRASAAPPVSSTAAAAAVPSSLAPAAAAPCATDCCC